MAFQAGLGASEAYGTILVRLRQVKAYAAQERAKIAAGPVEAGLLLELLFSLDGAITQMDAVSTTPGLAQYARGERDDPNYDVVAEYTAARAAIVAARDGLLAGLPSNANGRPDLHVWNGVVIEYRTFATGQTASLLPLLDAIDTAIAD